jgi:hypothetical protein
MATGLVDERAGAQPRDPRRIQRPRLGQVQRPRPGQVQRPRRAEPGSAQSQLVQPRPAQPRPSQPRPAQPRPSQPRPSQPRPLRPRPDQPGEHVTQPGERVIRPATAARPRTPFVLLLLALLGGGLVCLLLINTTLAEGSFQITAMQHKNASLAQQLQTAEQETTALKSPASIAARAKQLGMRPVGRLHFLDLKNGRVYSQPAREPGVTAVPGYTP